MKVKGIVLSVIMAFSFLSPAAVYGSIKETKSNFIEDSKEIPDSAKKLPPEIKGKELDKDDAEEVLKKTDEVMGKIESYKMDMVISISNLNNEINEVYHIFTKEKKGYSKADIMGDITERYYRDGKLYSHEKGKWVYRKSQFNKLIKSSNPIENNLDNYKMYQLKDKTYAIIDEKDEDTEKKKVKSIRVYLINKDFEVTQHFAYDISKSEDKDSELTVSFSFEFSDLNNMERIEFPEEFDDAKEVEEEEKIN